MLPNNLVYDDGATPNSIDEMIELAETTYRVEHEQTTLEAIALLPDGTVRTPAGPLQPTREFMETCAKVIGMPLSYAYTITPGLFRENFSSRQTETTVPVTVCRVGNVATGLVVDGKARYKPARTADVLRAVTRSQDLEFRRASISYAGVDLELVQPGNIVEPGVGDVIEVGVALTNSETGDRQLKASAYTYRLVCTNGAIMADSHGFARWPNDPRMTELGSMRAFEKSLAHLMQKLNSVSQLYTTPLRQLVPQLEFWNLWRRVAYLTTRNEADDVLEISEVERRDLQQAIREGGPQEAARLTDRQTYDVHNRITGAAHFRPMRVCRGCSSSAANYSAVRQAGRQCHRRIDLDCLVGCLRIPERWSPQARGVRFVRRSSGRLISTEQEVNGQLMQSPRCL